MPEPRRTPLEELCLQVRQLALGDIRSFLAKALEPPTPAAVDDAIGRAFPSLFLSLSLSLSQSLSARPSVTTRPSLHLLMTLITCPLSRAQVSVEANLDVLAVYSGDSLDPDKKAVTLMPGSVIQVAVRVCMCLVCASVRARTPLCVLSCSCVCACLTPMSLREG